MEIILTGILGFAE